MFGHDWKQITYPGRGMAYATVFPAPSSGLFRAVAIFLRDMSIALFELTDSNLNRILLAEPLDYIPAQDVCLDRLYQHLHMDGVVAVLEQYHAERFCDQHPSSAYYDEIEQKWQQSLIEGWELHRYAGWRLGLRRDIVYLSESSARSVLVSEAGVTLFVAHVAEATDGKGLFIVSENLSEDLLAGFMVWEDAINCMKIHRMLRRWVFMAALRREQSGED